MRKLFTVLLSVLMLLSLGVAYVNADGDTYTVRYEFYLQGDMSGDGMDELDDLLPTETEIPVGTEPELPDYFAVYPYDLLEFAGWDKAGVTYDDGTEIVVYRGFWKPAISANVISGSNPGGPEATPVTMGGTLGVPGSNVPAMYIDGGQVFCITPWITGYPLTGTSYYPGGIYGNASGSLPEPVANIIASYERGKIDAVTCQEAIWDYYGDNHGVDWHDVYDSSIQAWGSVWETYDALGTMQDLGGNVGYRVLPTYLKINKKSTATYNYLTNCSANYSLAGAVYGVYSDAACTNLVTTHTTGANGDTPTYDFGSNEGTYYVKEITPSKGFKLDPAVHTAVITRGAGTVTVTSNEAPYDDPSYIVLTKTSSDPDGYTQYLDTAEFTLRYYNLSPDATEVTGDPTITWVFKSEFDANGDTRVDFTKDYYVSGENTLWDEQGHLKLPIGIFTIEETKAPQTYARDTNIYIGKVWLDENNEIKVEINGGDHLDVSQTQLEQTEDVLILRTTAWFDNYQSYKGDPKLYPADGVGKIIDTVEYQNLTVGEEYVIKGKLVEKITNETYWTQDDCDNGLCTQDEVDTVKETTVTEGSLICEAETTFTPETADGSVDIEFVFDLEPYANTDMTAYEYLYTTSAPNDLITYHEDINDVGQTVHIDELYSAQFVLYKTANSSGGMRLNNAIFSATSHRVKRDGTEVDEDLGYFVTGGFVVTEDNEFTLTISNDPTVFGLPADTVDPAPTVIKTVQEASAMSSLTKKQTCIVTGLPEGLYFYTSSTDPTTINEVFVSRGAVYLENMAEDTEITWTELQAPAGYYKLSHPYITSVGRDYNVTVVNNYCVNMAIVIPVTGIE